MAVRRAWAFLLAAAALVLFVVGLGTALAPPEPDCGADPSVYCLEDAYARLRLVILGSWITATLLLGIGVWVLFAARGAPAAPVVRKAPPPVENSGRRIVSADPMNRPQPRPPEKEPAARR